MTHRRCMQARNRVPRSRHAAAIAAALTAMLALLPSVGEAAVEFVTLVGTCSKVDTIGDGGDLSLQAGNNVRLEVWGDGIDVNPAAHVTADDGDAGPVTARIISVGRQPGGCSSSRAPRPPQSLLEQWRNPS